jgi:hypothetical protein
MTRDWDRYRRREHERWERFERRNRRRAEPAEPDRSVWSDATASDSLPPEAPYPSRLSGHHGHHGYLPRPRGRHQPGPWGGSWDPWHGQRGRHGGEGLILLPLRLAFMIIRVVFGVLLGHGVPLARQGWRRYSEQRALSAARNVDPVAAFERRQRRAWRRVWARAAGAVVFVIGFTQVNGLAAHLGVGALAVGCAASAVVASWTAWRLSRATPPTPPPAPVPLPARGSPARPAMERLAERETVLADLFGHLGAGADSARAVAADAAAALRVHAARVTSVDRARRGAPADSRASLDTALATLRGQLDAGVAGYDALVVAAADALSASASVEAGDKVLTARLQDATDELAGLAAGLREVTAR